MTADRSSIRRAYLCHDIGKLVTRVDGNRLTDDEHAAESARFLREQLDDDTAARIVEGHHEETEPDDRETAALQAANTLSRNSPVKTDDILRGEVRDVFGTLGADAARTYPLEQLQLDEAVMFANNEREQNLPSAYGTLYENLTEYVRPDSSYERLVATLEVHTWCVPSDLERGVVPLYDHLRTTAALGEALYDSSLDTETLTRLGDGGSVNGELFTLVKGDVSGIQAFIHQMRSPDDAQERFAKRMRGRSTQLWLLTEGFARLFMDRLDLPATSLIWSGGGQFYAIVPPTSDEAIDDFTTEVNEWLMDRYRADLFFVVGRATATDSTTSFSTLFGRAASDTDSRKYQKLGPAVETLDSAVLGPPVEPCRSCGRDNLHDEERCRECRIQESLGGATATATHLSLVEGNHEDADYTLDLPNGGVSWRLTTYPTTAGRCYRLNSTQIEPDGSEDGFVFTGSTVPHGGAVDRVWSFSEMGELGRSSVEHVHVGKLDIDSLGEAITTGMEGGPARLAALSSALDRFFAGYANTLADALEYHTPTENACEECLGRLEDAPARTVDHSRGPELTESETYYRLDEDSEVHIHEKCTARVSPIYIGFAGGDDMFFVGPWDEAIDFGRDVRGQFATYTDETLSLSGGYLLTRSKYPIGRAVKQAKIHLEQAKKVTYDGQRKNALRLFSEVQTWETAGGDYPDMKTLLQLGERLEELIMSEELPRSLLYQFTKISEEEYPKQLLPGDASVRKDTSWRLKYMLARHFEGELLRELERELPPALPWIEVPVSWASLATR
jgi:CRISPR-associated protein Csm1